MIWGGGSTSLFCMWIFSCPNTSCWKAYSFRIEFLCHSCQTSIAHKCKCLFLDSQFYAIDPYVYTCVNIAFSLLLSFMSNFEIGKGESSNFVLLFQYRLGCSRSLNFHRNFRISLSISVKISQQGFLWGLWWICGLIWGVLQS